MKLILAVLFVAVTSFAASATAENSRPNVIFILADDLGWSDTTLYGHTQYYKTPNLERLAARGTVFNRAYSSSPLCSPTRSSILTGLSPARTGITAPNCHLPEVRMNASVRNKAPANAKSLICESATRLNSSYYTLAEAFKASGYATGHFGKWHLGPDPYSPLQHGFDVDLPHTAGPGPAGSFVSPWKFKDFVENYPEEHIEDRMSEEAVSWMEQQAGTPFFMNYWQFSVHAPFNAKAGLIEKYRATVNPDDAQHSPTYAAMVESMDDAVGTLLDALDRLKIADNTIVVFYSDNGGNMYNEVDLTTPTSNRPLRGGKATLYEGGIRVPCVVSWPGLTKPGSRSEAIIQSQDFYPTFVDLLDLATEPNQSFDGVSIADALAEKPFEHPPMFTYFPHGPAVPDNLPPAVVVTDGDWKLIRIFHYGENGEHAYQLYNLKDDLGETNDLSAVHPERVTQMDKLISDFLVTTNAVTPKPNPAYDPTAKSPLERSKRKNKLISSKPAASR